MGKRASPVARAARERLTCLAPCRGVLPRPQPAAAAHRRARHRACHSDYALSVTRAHICPLVRKPRRPAALACKAMGGPPARRAARLQLALAALLLCAAGAAGAVAGAGRGRVSRGGPARCHDGCLRPPTLPSPLAPPLPPSPQPGRPGEGGRAAAQVVGGWGAWVVFRGAAAARVPTPLSRLPTTTLASPLQPAAQQGRHLPALPRRHLL